MLKRAGARVHDIAESRSLRTASLIFDRLKFLRKIFPAQAVHDFIIADDQPAKPSPECNDDLPVRISDEQLLHSQLQELRIRRLAMGSLRSPILRIARRAPVSGRDAGESRKAAALIPPA